MKSNPFLTVCFVVVSASACKSGPKPMPQSDPVDPMSSACSIRTEHDGKVSTVRTVAEGDKLRQLVDLDGDGEPDEQRLVTLNDPGRVARIDVTDDAGKPLRTETKTWDGKQLLREEIDNLDAAGNPGIDGVPDKIRQIEWEGDKMMRDALDQVDEAGLLGTDGKPDILTTWTWENGVRTTGTTRDTRDEVVLHIQHLAWKGDDLTEVKSDFGGDGTIENTTAMTWVDGRLTRSESSGLLGASTTTFEYCR